MVGFLIAENLNKFQNFFSPKLSISLKILPGDIKRKTAQIISEENSKEKAYIFESGESISGSAYIDVKNGATIEHNGISVCLIGKIGILYASKCYDWVFNAIETPYDSFQGSLVAVRYFVQLYVHKIYGLPESKIAAFIIQNPSPPIDSIQPFQMEVGIDDCLLLEFTYDKFAYPLKGVVTGTIRFILVRLKIKCMDIDIIRVETINIGNSQKSVSEKVAKFEIMDGTPSKSVTLPVKMYLSGYHLTPTYSNIANKFSVTYFVNLVLLDEENQR